MLQHALHRHRRGVAERADRAALDVVGHGVEQGQVFHLALAMFDAVDHAPQPAGAFAARRALAAALVLIEVGQAQQALDHAAPLVHHDDRARAEHRAGLGDGVVVHRDVHHRLGRQHRRGRAAGDHGLERTAAADAARQFEQLRERRAERDLVVAGAFDVADDREDFGAAVVRLADLEVRAAAVVDDPRHRGEGLRVVDRRRLAVEAEARRKRRLEARLALLAFERFEQRCFFAADVGAEAVEGVQLEAELAARDLVAEKARARALLPTLLRSARRSRRFRRGCSCSPPSRPSRRRRSPCLR